MVSSAETNQQASQQRQQKSKSSEPLEAATETNNNEASAASAELTSASSPDAVAVSDQPLVSSAGMSPANTCCAQEEVDVVAEKKIPEEETNRLLLSNSSSSSRIPANGHQQQDVEQQDPSVKTTNQQQQQQHEKQLRKLSYLQALLIRKWPYLPALILIMGSLLFGILLSALTVFLMHGQTSECVSGALRSGRLLAVDSSPLLASRLDFDPHHGHHHESAHLPLISTSHLSSASEAASLAPGAGAAAAASASGSADVAAPKSAATATTSRFQRLPTSVWPIHYDLFVQPYLYEPFNFTGKVLIRIKCTEATDNITLHALDLDLNSTTITLSELPTTTTTTGRLTRQTKQPEPKVSGLSQDRQLQHSIIRLDRRLAAGREYLLAIDFVGFLNDDLAGFYKIKYELKQNSTAAAASGQQQSTTTWIAATQFQATDARRAFPCFDEPLYKATFSIKIKHWKNMTSLSNMPIVERQDSEDGHWVTDVFEKSHRMSTYLVAFAVTNFESRSEGNISVWTRPGFAHTAEYSLRIAGKLLRYYEEFFGIEYPLPKMDMIALPDFNAGAMENWGLITYRETSMLFDEATSSIANKQRVATVVAHELAHQWFGNLVTPKWWDDLWLNEGFASYVEYIGVDKIEPSWKILDQFATEELQNVFRVDDLSSSHQISIPVNDPEEISEIFDHISYAKSASVIRMMNYFLTPDVFKTGLRRYLRALKYSNAEQSDLWAHLTEASKLVRANSSSSSAVEPVDVSKVMNSWTLQVGYPLVTLTRQYGGAASRRAHLGQVRYRPTREQQLAHVNGSQPVQKWEVPITYTWRSERNFDPITRVWLHQNDSGAVELSSSMLPASDDDWMLVNLGQVGYYRVNYDLQNWRLLIKQLNEDHQAIGTTNRAQLLDDIFELARSGTLDYRFALEATKYLKAERDFLPWDTVLTSFGYIDEMLQRTPLYGQWQDYVGDLIKPYYARYKDSEHWTIRASSRIGANETTAAVPASDNALEQYNLVNALIWACQVDGHCIGKAKSLFRDWRETGRNEINPVVRFTVYCTAIENGDKEDWDFLWRAYEREQNSSERDRILKALSCSKQMWVLSRYLEWTFNKSKPIRRQDGAYIFRMIAKNNYGRDIAFNFVRERWTTIREHYGKTSFSLGALIRSLSYAMNTQIELNQLMNFYESVKSDVGTGKRSFQNAIEEVETNVQWRNRNYKILEDWLTTAGSVSKTA